MDNGNAGGSGNGGSPQPNPACFPDTKMSAEVMRRVLPSHAEISDDIKQIMQKCVSEFVCFITCAANEHCQHEQRETITADDVLWVMSKFGFDDYIEPLTLCLRHYHEDGGERGSLREERLLKRPMVDPASSGSTSQCADSDVESPEK